MKDNLRNIDSNNIIRLISDVVLYNIDKVRDFKENEIYYRNDVIYRNDAADGKYKLHVCKKESVTGVFNPDDWDIYTFRLERNSVILESEFKSPGDGTTVCPINQPLYDVDKDSLVIYHSVRGRLFRTRDWTLNSDRLTITLKFGLNTGELILFEVHK